MKSFSGQSTYFVCLKFMLSVQFPGHLKVIIVGIVSKETGAASVAN